MTTVNVVHAGDVGAFNALLFPDQSPQTSMYIQNQLNSFSQTLTDIGRQFVEASKAIYDKINDSDAVRMARAAMRMAKGMFHPNMIIPLETIEDIRGAQPMMQRFIMAEPTLREQYHRQLVDGYSDTYIDVEPKRIKDDHYDYRRVMDGIIVEEVDEDGNDSWVAHQYFDELRPGDKHLDLVEQSSILRTWEVMLMGLTAGNDPTDIYAKK